MGIELMPRGRFEGDHEGLAAVFKAHVEKSLNFLNYHEGKKMPLDKKGIQKHWQLFTDLEALQSNVAFKKKTLIAVLRAAICDSQWAKRLMPAETVDWCETMQKRLNVFLRHGQQLRIKKPKWFLNWLPSSGSGASAGADSTGKAAAETEATAEDVGEAEGEDGESEPGGNHS